MASTKSTGGLTNLMLLLARVALGAWFVLHGYGILDGDGGRQAFIDQHLTHARELLPDSLARTYLVALPYVEIATGAMLVFGILTRVAGMLAAIQLAAVLLGVTGAKFHVQIGASSPFSPELVLLALALLFVATGGGGLGFDRRVTGGKGKSKSSADADD